MTEKQEEKIAQDVSAAEEMLKDLQRELNDPEGTLLEKVDAVIYIAMKLKDKLHFIDTQYIKEIIETYEGK